MPHAPSGPRLAVTATIGKIAGVLSGGGTRASIGPRLGDHSPHMGQVVFLRKGGETFAWNRSEHNDAGLFFPGSSLVGIAPQQLYLPAASGKFPISGYFETYAAAGVDEFTMQSLPGQMTGRAATGGPEVWLAPATAPTSRMIRGVPVAATTAGDRLIVADPSVGTFWMYSPT